MPSRENKKKGKKMKSKKQVAFLLSKVSPLSDKQKEKLKGEFHKGSVKIKNGKKKKK